MYGLSTFLYGLGFFFPPLFLPTFVGAVGEGPKSGALCLAVMAVAQVVGQLAFGYLSDKSMSVSVLAITCSLVGTTASLTLWGLAKSLAPLVLFSVVYGFFAYGFTSMRVAMGRAVSDDASAAVATYSLLVFLQGIGNVLAGPLSGLLVKGVVGGGYGLGRYKMLVGFTGSCLLGSAVVIGVWHLRPKGVR